MPAPPTNLQMVGMIPMPDSAYESAMKANISALRRAMTPQGLNTAGLRPPPTRLMPVGQDANGNLYALVETCNPNYRPTAVPLSSFYPANAATPGTPPPEFIPLDALKNAPPPPQEASPAVARQAATRPAATPQGTLMALESIPQGEGEQLLLASPEEERQLGQRVAEALQKAGLASKPAAAVAAPSAVGSQAATTGQALGKLGTADAFSKVGGAARVAQSGQEAAQIAQAVPGIPATGAARAASHAAAQTAQLAQAAQTGGAGAAAAAGQAGSAVSGFSRTPLPVASPKAPQLDTTQSERLIRAMQHMQAGREARTQALLQQAAQTTGRPDATGGMGSTVLGVTAAQDPGRSQALFQQMAAEKAAGLQPTGGVYQRLQAALAANPPIPTRG